jgi:hypothetical protein
MESSFRFDGRDRVCESPRRAFYTPKTLNDPERDTHEQTTSTSHAAKPRQPGERLARPYHRVTS